MDLLSPNSRCRWSFPTPAGGVPGCGRRRNLCFSRAGVNEGCGRFFSSLKVRSQLIAFPCLQVATAALQLLLHYVEALRDRVTNQYAAAAALFLFSPSIASDQQLCALCFRAARQYFPYDILFLEPIFFPRLPPAARVEAEEICSKLRRAGREVVVHRRGGAEGGPELRDHVEGGHGRPDFDWNSDDQPPGAARDWEVLPQGGAREAGAEREVGGDVPR